MITGREDVCLDTQKEKKGYRYRQRDIKIKRERAPSLRTDLTGDTIESRGERRRRWTAGGLYLHSISLSFSFSPEVNG